MSAEVKRFQGNAFTWYSTGSVGLTGSVRIPVLVRSSSWGRLSERLLLVLIET